MIEDARSVRLQPDLEPDHHWIRVATCDQVPPRQGRSITIGDRELAIFNLGDRYFATDNRCPHKAGPLADGIVTGTSVVCPLHTWKINLVDGCVQRPPGSEHCVATYAVRVEDGVIAVSVPS
jgi:nitrite reductase (NADH) small subunit